jgi:hypothetical protein
LANLNLVAEVGTPTTRYVLVDVTGCDLKESLVVYDTLHGYISWYHDIAFETGGSQLSGYSYSKEGTILGIVDQAGVYEWSFGGQPLLAIPFPDCGSGDFDGPRPAPRCAPLTVGELVRVDRGAPSKRDARGHAMGRHGVYVSTTACRSW